MTRPVIALLTDFGTRDHYVGVMKGVALGTCPDASLVDITHDIPPQDVFAGALELAAAYQYFPAGTVFLVVVDPGVGSTRRGIAAEAGNYRFVGPDNGVLSLAFRKSPPRLVVELTETKYARASMSRTFEGRDRFAPAAAWLAGGTAVAALGPPIENYQRLVMSAPVLRNGALHGTVVRVDRFGNLITNIDRRLLDTAAAGGAVTVLIGDAVIPALVGTYAESPAGALCALFGSTDHLEVAMNGASAADRLGIGRGADVCVSILRR